jgi:hypothetical protein
MPRPVDTAHYTLTEAERQERWDLIAELAAIDEDVKAQIAALEASRSGNGGEASRLRHQVHTAELIDDPLICEPHGIESIMEGPGAIAMIHIPDGATCYAAALGRRSDFEPDWLATYREVKAKRGAR